MKEPIENGAADRARYQKIVRDHRKAVGLCHDCGGGAAPNRTLCRKHLEAAQDRAKRRRAARIILGVCERCGRFPLPGRRLCGQHIADQTARARRSSTKRRVARLNEGQCVLCDGALASGDTSYCGKCRRSRTDADVRKRALRARRGRCTKCGGGSPVAGRRWCASCCAEKRAYRRAKHRRETRRRREREIRRVVINRYGGRCACCGESAFDALVIDHVRGGGNNDRKRNGNIYRRLFRVARRQRGFRVLCHTCNHIARPHGGRCACQDDATRQDVMGTEKNRRQNLACLYDRDRA